MPIRPVDMQVILPKAVDAVKTNNAMAMRNDVKFQDYANEFENRTDLARTQVLKSAEAEQNAVNKDGRNGSNEKQQNSNKKHNTKNSNKKQNRINETNSIFDFEV
ncbi:MAG: hypothetical protein FWF57_09235 [Defluviitaleaceae bacterium]|nr:hypothetical protein [Defluviitaleaceae bacterium]